jgi:hypothetical protein
VGHVDVYAAEHGDEALRTALLAQRLSSSHATLALRPTEDGGALVPTAGMNSALRQIPLSLSLCTCLRSLPLTAGGACGLPKDGGDIHLQQRDVTLATFQVWTCLGPLPLFPGTGRRVPAHAPPPGAPSRGPHRRQVLRPGRRERVLGRLCPPRAARALALRGHGGLRVLLRRVRGALHQFSLFFSIAILSPRQRPTIYCAPWAASAAPTPPTPSPAACPTPWPLGAHAKRCARRARTASAAAPRSSAKIHVY